jgi:hypothetical protein
MRVSKDIKPWLVIGTLTIALGLIISVYIGILPSPFEGALGDFKAPSYLPAGYVKGETNTTNIDKTYTYTNNNQGTFFMLGATNDPQKSSLKEVFQPLSQEDGMPVANEPLTINGHDTTFQVQKMDLMGVELNIFHVTWHCDQTGLTCAATGMLLPTEINEFKEMIQSVKCHSKGFF